MKWPFESIGNLAEVNPRIAAADRPAPDEQVSFVPMAAISEKTCRIEEQTERCFAEVSKGYTPFRRGDVLIAKITPCFENGKMALAENLSHELGFGTTEFHVLRPSDKLIGAYLFNLLRAPFIRKAGAMKMKGAAGQRRVPADFFATLQIPLPPLGEQKRIAAILDAADALRAMRRETLAQLDTLLQSTFLDMFGDPVTNPKGWKKETIDDLVTNIDSGWSPSCLDRPANKDEWGVLKLGAVTSCYFRDDQSKALPEGIVPRPELEVRKGDLLFTRKNTYDLVAACAFVHKTRPKLLLPDLIFRLRFTNNARIEPMFAWQQLINQKLRKKIQSLAGGAAGSMPNISKAKLRKVELATPPLPLQRRFAAIVESVEQQKTRLRAHLAELDILFASLQDRAFKGAL